MWLYVTQGQRPASVLMSFEMYMLLLTGASWWLDELRYDNVRVNSWRDQHGNTIRIIKNVNVSRVQLILWLQQNSKSTTWQWCHGTPPLSLPSFSRHLVNLMTSWIPTPQSNKTSPDHRWVVTLGAIVHVPIRSSHRAHKTTQINSPIVSPGDVVSAYLVMSTNHTSIFARFSGPFGPGKDSVMSPQ